MWSAGALLELDDRAKMEEHMRSLKCLDLPPVPAGSNETIFEYVVNDNGMLNIDLVCLVAQFYHGTDIPSVALQLRTEVLI